LTSNGIAEKKVRGEPHLVVEVPRVLPLTTKEVGPSFLVAVTEIRASSARFWAEIEIPSPLARSETTTSEGVTAIVQPEGYLWNSRCQEKLQRKKERKEEKKKKNIKRK